MEDYSAHPKEARSACQKVDHSACPTEEHSAHPMERPKVDHSAHPKVARLASPMARPKVDRSACPTGEHSACPTGEHSASPMALPFFPRERGGSQSSSSLCIADQFRRSQGSLKTPVTPRLHSSQTQVRVAHQCSGRGSLQVSFEWLYSLIATSMVVAPSAVGVNVAV